MSVWGIELPVAETRCGRSLVSSLGARENALNGSIPSVSQWTRTEEVAVVGVSGLARARVFPHSAVRVAGKPRPPGGPFESVVVLVFLRTTGGRLVYCARSLSFSLSLFH